MPPPSWIGMKLWVDVASAEFGDKFKFLSVQVGVRDKICKKLKARETLPTPRVSRDASLGMISA